MKANICNWVGEKVLSNIDVDICDIEKLVSKHDVMLREVNGEIQLFIDKKGEKFAMG